MPATYSSQEKNKETVDRKICSHFLEVENGETRKEERNRKQ